MEIGILHVPTNVRDAGALAGRAERLGITWMGIADSPQIFGSLYPTMQHSLSLTKSIKLGPLVTNPVTRHESVHASTYVAFEDLYPGRTFFGVAAGDSAVHSVGLRPASARGVSALAEAMRSACGPRLPIITAVGGPKAACGVSNASDSVLFGCGLDSSQMLALSASVPSPKRRWLYIPSYFVENAGQTLGAQREIRAPIVSFSRHALHGNLLAKGVPSDLADGLTAMYQQYAFQDHSRLDAANARLMEGRRAEEDYLVRRFSLVGTPEAAAERVIDFASMVGDFDLFLGTMVPDLDQHLALLADRFKERLGRLL